jgi:hypothetical protein
LVGLGRGGLGSILVNCLGMVSKDTRLGFIMSFNSFSYFIGQIVFSIVFNVCTAGRVDGAAGYNEALMIGSGSMCVALVLGLGLMR